MAEKAIENELSCTICLDAYTDPKILQCFHVYCQRCLVKLVTKDHQGQLFLSCPICRHVTLIPAKGTRDLPSAFHVNRLQEILDQHKKTASEPTSAERVVEEPKRITSDFICSEHDGREVELFCETCEELVCCKCAVKGSKHHSHDYRDISESFERYKEEVTPPLERLTEKMAAATEMLTQLDRHCDKITHQRETAEAEIRKNSEQLHDIINNRQDQLIHKLNHITRRKLKCLATQRDQMETLQAQLSSCLEFTRESLKTGIQQREVLSMKPNIINKVRELANPPQPNIFKPWTDADIVFSSSAKDIASMCGSYGSVYEQNSPDPSKCVVTGRGTWEAEVGKKATAILKAKTVQGEPWREDSVSKRFQIELVSETTGRKEIGSVDSSVKQRKQGQYMISYWPYCQGKHQLHIKAAGQHIQDSPLRVNATIRLRDLGTPPKQMVLTRGDPWGVAINRRGEVVVAEHGAHTVSVLSPQGEKLYSIGTQSGQLQNPSSVAVDGEGNILVLDYGKHFILKYTTEGNFIEAVGSEGSGPLQFRCPSCIAYSKRKEKVYVVDTNNHRVQVLTPDLRFISMFGKRGTYKGEFLSPHGIATDYIGNVYVTDYRIQVFTAEGRPLKEFGIQPRGELVKEYGNCFSDTDCYWGVCIDARGLLYICDRWSNCVAVFTTEGKLVTKLSIEKTQQDQYDSFHGLTAGEGVIYVCGKQKTKTEASSSLHEFLNQLSFTH